MKVKEEVLQKTCVMQKITQVFFVFVILNGNLQGIDPWSKIVVTSKKATCNKDKNNPKDFIFTYMDDVVVTLADKSTVKANALELILDGSKDLKKKGVVVGGKQSQQTSEKKSLSQLKKLSFKDHVVLNSGQRKVCANKADIDLIKNTCTLDGDVKIWQFKKHQKDVPIAIESQKAVMHLKTYAVNLVGTSTKPVSTTIELEGHPSIQKKTKIRSKGKKKTA